MVCCHVSPAPSAVGPPPAGLPPLSLRIILTIFLTTLLALLLLPSHSSFPSLSLLVSACLVIETSNPSSPPNPPLPIPIDRQVTNYWHHHYFLEASPPLNPNRGGRSLVLVGADRWRWRWRWPRKWRAVLVDFGARRGWRRQELKEI